MKNNKYSRFFAILKQANANGLPLTKEEAIRDFTSGRTDSLRDLSHNELTGLELQLSSLISQRQLQISQTSRPETMVNGRLINKAPKADGLRKRIIACFLSIGRTAKAAKDWAEKNGVDGQKHGFNYYTNQELKILGDVAVKIKNQHIHAVTKNRL